MASKCPKADIWCTSGYETIKISYKWVINNFSGCPHEPGQFIRSSTFGSDEDIKTKWYLDIYPYGDKKENKEFVSIFLNLKESDKKKVLVKDSVGIVDSNQQIYNQLEGKSKFESNNNGWGYDQYISRSQIETPEKQLLPNDVLTIYFEITYFCECQTTSGQNIEPKRNRNKLLEDMAALYQNPNDSDVEIVVKGYKFSAHKLILMTRSSVFAAMFKHPMKESQQNKVFIDDIEKEVFSKVLRYIYTDSVVNEDIESNKQLLSAADKYNLDDLKSICEEYIGSQLTVESVCDVLILADNHWAQELKTNAIDFIKKKKNQVIKTMGWVRVVIYTPDLLELF